MTIEERKCEFELWVNNLEERVEAWKKQLPESLAKNLYYGSPWSLYYLEEYITKNYRTFNDLYEDKIFYDGVYSFVGESFRKSLDDATWHIELRPEYKKHLFYNHPVILNKYLGQVEVRLSRAFGKDGSPQKNFNYVIELFAYLKLRIKAKAAHNYWKEIKGEAVEKKPKVINKGRSYENFILLTVPDFQLFEAANLIKATFDKRKNTNVSYQFVNNGYFKLILQSGYEFHFQMNRANYLIEESKDMANNHKGSLNKELIGQCASRIEFWGDEDDMEYFNYAIWALQAFDDRSKFFVYDLQEGFLE